jgi:heme exporter protein A
MIQIQQLAKTYGYLPVLKPFDLEIPRGQFVALLGANGSGKSTLLRLICGLSKPTSGTIYVGGWRIPQEAAAVRAQIGMVSHKALLYDNLTARENLRFFAKLYQLPDTEQRIQELLERVGLRKRSESLVRTFSRGMLQRLSIARALLHRPHVLLFDEPYTGLDQAASATLDTLLREAHAEGHTILMTTHELERAARLAERALILQRGSVAYDAPPPPNLPTLYAQVTGALPGQ